APAAANPGERVAIARRQRRCAAKRLELWHVGDADEDRIDRHRADRRVRRLLPRRHLVQRQQLEHALAGGCQPCRDVLHIADVADAPAFGRRTREQRDEQPRPAPAGGRTHVDVALQAKCRRTRSMPSPNDASGGRRLTTRNDSRGKSKKYPGCASTPTWVRRRTARSSSGSNDGTCITPYQPPALRATPQDGTRADMVISPR